MPDTQSFSIFTAGQPPRFTIISRYQPAISTATYLHAQQAKFPPSRRSAAIYALAKASFCVVMRFETSEHAGRAREVLQPLQTPSVAHASSSRRR